MGLTFKILIRQLRYKNRGHLRESCTAAPGPVLERNTRLCGSDAGVHFSWRFRKTLFPKLPRYFWNFKLYLVNRAQSLVCVFLLLLFSFVLKKLIHYGSPFPDTHPPRTMRPGTVGNPDNDSCNNTEWCMKHRSSAAQYVGSSRQMSLLPLKFQKLLFKNRTSIFLLHFLQYKSIIFFLPI